MVNSLTNPNGSLNISRLEILFDLNSVEAILKINWANQEEEYEIVWLGSRNGKFSIKSFYQYLGKINLASLVEEIWNSKLHERTNFFIRKLKNNGLMVKEKSVRRIIQIEDDQCLHGCHCEESVTHVFFHCSFARGV